MKLGRVLLVSALVHGALLLAPIPHPSTQAPPEPAPDLVWMQIAAPAPSPRAPASARAAASSPAEEAIAAPAAPAAPAATAAAATRTNIRARAFPDGRARAAPAAPAALAGLESAAVELPPGEDEGAGEAGPAGARVPGHIPGPATPGSLLPGPVAGHASVLAPAPVPAFDPRAYGEHVRRRIDAHKQYPPRARRLGLEGVATVIVAVDARGHLAQPPRIARSSGVAALDDEALRMARAAAPFPPPGRGPGPAGADARPAPLVLHVPVRFSLADAP